MAPIKYLILKDQKLIIRYFEGKTYIKDIYNSVSESTIDTSYNSSFSSIYDFRYAELVADLVDISRIAEKVRHNAKILNKRKLALLTNSPSQVVFSTFMKYMSKTGLINMEIFSTLKGCLEFLSLDMKYFDIINNKLEELKGNHNNYQV